MSRTVIAIFDDVEQGAEGLRRLEERGVERGAVEVFSREPLPEGALEVDRTPVRVPWIALGFAIVGAGIGFVIAGGTMWVTQLPTGGKPIMAAPTIGIISYEVTMLAALIMTFVGALFEMRLPSWRPRAHASSLGEGQVALAVEADAVGGATIDEAMRQAGAVSVELQDRGLR